MHAMLLCAGLGTRFRPLTNKIAKPAIPFMDVPLCIYPLFYLEQAGLTDLVVNVHHLPDTVKQVIKYFKADGYNIHYSDETKKILGSGGGIAKAKDFLKDADHFFVINGDEVFFPTEADFLLKVLDFHKSNNALVTIVTCDHPQAGCELGAIEVNANKITKLGRRYEKENFQKLSPSERARLKHNSGIYIYSHRIFDYMPTDKEEFHIFKDCLDIAIAKGENVLSYYMPELTWLDMSSAEDLKASTEEARILLKQDGPQARILKQIMNRK